MKGRKVNLREREGGELVRERAKRELGAGGACCWVPVKASRLKATSLCGGGGDRQTCKGFILPLETVSFDCKVYVVLIGVTVCRGEKYMGTTVLST